MKIADAFVLISKDDTPLKRGLAATRKDVESWTSSVSGLIKQALGFSLGQAFTAGVQGILGSLRQLSKGLVGGNADFEQYQTRFSVLLGSMDAAKQRIAELAQFGATTPFDLPGVVEADTIIQGFGLHAEEAAAKFGFSGAEIRRIAGDVASGAGASFQEIALNIGKFSTGATGEAIMRFQEMGIVTRDQLRAMGIEFSKSGELVSPLPEAMNAVLTIMQEKYGGMMQAQSSTFSGMLSNLRDWVGNAQRFLGEPTFEILKDQLKDLLTFLNSSAVTNALTGLRDLFSAIFAGIVGSVRGLSGGVIGAFEGMFGDTDQAMQGFADNAFGWGENIAISFAEGIYAAASAVIDALSYLGALMTYWLVPHSPPKLLPNLDQWGKGAAEVWINGWTKADVSAFDDLAGLVERALGSLGLEDSAAMSALMGAREGIKRAVDEINRMGSVSQATLSLITEHAGNLAGPIGDYAQALAEVTRRTKEVEAAQERVNKVNEKYDAILEAQNARLSAIREKEQAFNNEQERARLQEILASATSGEREKEQARLALERLDIEEEIAQTEKKKNKELTAAEKQLKDAQDGLDMAQERLDLSKAYIEQLTEENELLQEQRDLLSGKGGAGGAGKKAGGAGAPKIPGMPKPGGPSIFDQLKEQIGGMFWGDGGGDDIATRIGLITGRIQDIFKDLRKQGEDMGSIWGKFGDAFEKFVTKPIQAFLDTDNGKLLVNILEKIALVVGGVVLVNGFIALGSAIAGLFSPIMLVVVGLGILWGILSDEKVQESWKGNWDNIVESTELAKGRLSELWDGFILTWTAFGDALISGGDALWTGFILTWTAFGDLLVNGWNALWTGISLTAQAIWDALRNGLANTVTFWSSRLLAMWSAAVATWTSIKTFAQNWIGEVKKSIQEKIEELRTNWEQKWGEIKKRALFFLQSLIEALPEKLTTLSSDILTSISTLISDLLAKVSEWEGIGKSFIQGIIDGASSLAGSLVSAVVQMVLDAVSGAAEAIMSHSPSRLTANVLGKPMAEGVGVGWEESMKTVQDQLANSLVNAIPSPAMMGTGDIYETVNLYGKHDIGTAYSDIRQAQERRRYTQGLMRRR